ncbi:MAG: hypothetical protein QW379_01765 [Thermoplasmata archaeon]
MEKIGREYGERDKGKDPAHYIFNQGKMGPGRGPTYVYVDNRPVEKIINEINDLDKSLGRGGLSGDETKRINEMRFGLLRKLLYIGPNLKPS